MGHSFIRRLHAMCRSPMYANLRLLRSYVCFAGRLGNRNISYLSDVEDWLDTYYEQLYECNTVLLEAGTNDLLHHWWYGYPEALAMEVFEVAKRMRRMGAQRVILMQVLFRSGRAALPRWEQDRSPAAVRRAQRVFNAMALAYNRKLARLCALWDGSIVFRPQRSLKQRWSRKLSGDGCHIAPRYMYGYYSNVRSALVAEGFRTQR